MKTIVNGVPVEMTPEEEAAFNAALIPSLDQAKAQKRSAIVNEWDKRDSKSYSIEVPGNLNAYYALTLNNARALKAELDAATTVEQVQAIDETAGWP